MNAAARLIHQNVLSRHFIFSFSLARRQMLILALVCIMILSALSTVYITYHTRVLQAQLQKSRNSQAHLQMQHSQFLLERSTWTMEARVQQIAEKKLGMVFPNHQSVVIIHE